ncbi:hypothetical protein IWZ01DRAFT_538924 [Phyllosticta capitalensis]
MRPLLAISPLRLVLLSLAVTRIAAAASAERLNADVNPEAAGSPDSEQLDAPIILSPFLPGIAINMPERQAVLPADEGYRRKDYALPNNVNGSNASAATPLPSAPATTPAPTDAPRIYTPGLLQKRAGTTCPTSYSACAALGAPGLCCRRNTNCALDQAGHVACCPVNAACTGTIRGSTVAGGYSVSTTTLGVSATSSLVQVTTTDSTGGFVAVGTTFVATPNAAGRVAVPWLLGWF